jgi:hypothetical protein
MFCENGFKIDTNGCEYCECQEAKPNICSDVMCMMFCVNGFKKDEMAASIVLAKICELSKK